jgi:phosphate-selective porin OprO/OprP
MSKSKAFLFMCYKPFLFVVVLCYFPGLNNGLNAQIESDEKPLLDITDGLSFKKDSVFKLNLRFRMQNRFGFQSVDGENPFGIRHFDARVRRMRLRLDGYLINRKLQYYVQLSFSRWDQNLESGAIAQTVRDAILYYSVNKNLYFGFGQSKLPGNRQRVISSGNLQFADRSIANSTFNIDRDFGFFGYYTLPAGNSVWYLKGAITTGEGRNALTYNNGLCYTGRLEFLPFGVFEQNTDYMEGDFTYSDKPGLSLALTYSYNNKAVFSAGQLGSLMPRTQDFQYIIADVMFKYRGWAFMGEYFDKRADYSVFFDEGAQRMRTIPAGKGYNSQFSYCFPSLYEPAVRFAGVFPERNSERFRPAHQECWLGVTKYINGHRIKAQLNIIYTWLDKRFTPDNSELNYWSGMFQVEFGI